MINSLTLELPVEEKDAKRREIDNSLCRLLLFLDDNKENYYSFLAKLVELNKPKHKEICVVSCGEFNDLCNIESEVNITYNKKLNYCITKDNKALVTIFEKWEAEALVLFYSDEQGCIELTSNLEKLEPKPWPFSKGGYDFPFLKQINLCELFIFYSMTYSAFEIFGYKKNVMNFYEQVKNTIDR